MDSLDRLERLLNSALTYRDSVVTLASPARRTLLEMLKGVNTLRALITTNEARLSELCATWMATYDRMHEIGSRPHPRAEAERRSLESRIREWPQALPPDDTSISAELQALDAEYLALLQERLDQVPLTDAAYKNIETAPLRLGLEVTASILEVPGIVGRAGEHGTALLNRVQLGQLKAEITSSLRERVAEAKGGRVIPVVRLALYGLEAIPTALGALDTALAMYDSLDGDRVTSPEGVQALMRCRGDLLQLVEHESVRGAMLSWGCEAFALIEARPGR